MLGTQTRPWAPTPVVRARSPSPYSIFSAGARQGKDLPDGFWAGAGWPLSSLVGTATPAPGATGPHVGRAGSWLPTAHLGPGA